MKTELTRLMEARLKPALEGELYTGELDRTLYATDASLYRMMPEAVLIPESERDVVAAVRFCRDHNLSITPRGSGSGLAGSAINHGLILDFVPRMNRILEVDEENGSVAVEPGVFQTALNKELEKTGLFFPPNPSSADYCSIGGMIACNSSGGKSVKYGSTKEYVESLKLVLHNGDVVESRAFGESDPDFIRLLQEDSEWGRINREVYELCRRERDIIERHTPDVPKNCSGYDLAGVLREGVFDINRAVIGSEGTLAMIVEARLKLVPLPEAKKSALLFFDSLEKGGLAIIEILKFQPSTCEIMAEDFIRLVKENRPDVGSFMPGTAGTALLLEFEGESEEHLNSMMDACTEHLKKTGLLLEAKIAHTPDEQTRLWAMRKAALPIIYNRPGQNSPVTFVEDCTVRPDKLPLYIEGIFRIFEKHGVESTAYGHGGDGNIHTRPLMNLRRKEDVDKLEPIARDVYKLAQSLGATYSGEHGDGMLRSMFLPDLFGPLYGLFSRLKDIFDPRGMVNPGKILNDEGTLFQEFLRMGNGDYSVVPTGTGIDRKEVIANLEKCHGCSQCRTFCPLVLTTGSEKALPRAKNNLARSLLYGDLDRGDFLVGQEVKEMLDLCYNCKTCLHECPTHVDTGLVMQHLKGHYFSRKGATPGETVISNAEFLGKAATFFNPISNAALKLKPVRFALEKTLGLTREIDLPPYAGRPFKAAGPSMVQSREREPKGRIVYFAGCTAKYNQKGEARAFTNIMKLLGYEVLMPEQNCCGLAKLGLGNYKGAGKHIRANTESFLSYVEEGCIPVTTCPSCHFMMSEGAASIVDSREVRLVGGKFREAVEFLSELLSEEGRDIVFKSVNRRIAWKNACHGKETGQAARELFSRIPGLEIAEWYDKCCGMGGTFGMKSRHREKSEAIGRVMADAMIGSGADTMSTSCGACAVQVESVTGRSTVHPLVILAESMGL